MNAKHEAKTDESVRSTKSFALTEKSEKVMRDDSRKDSPPLIKKIDGIPKLSVEPSEKKMPSPNKRLGVMPRLKKPEPDSVPLIPIDEKFKKRWHIEGIIGKGGYGEIYTAIDMKIAEEVAIKAEPMERKGKVARRMILEQAVLVKLQGKPHSPLILGSGHTEKFNYIVLQLLSINLGDIRRMSPTRKLSKSTVGRITVQSIAALRDLHEIGYLHRDVKPANICFGITPTTRHVLKLLDYGLVRRYKEADGEWRQHRAKAGFRGTQRYVSTRVHRRLEQTPADDMVSLMYTAFELLAGELPWRNLEKSDDIWKIKEAVQYGHIEYFSGMARELFDFSKLVSGLDPMVDPPYATLQTCVKKLYSPKKLTDLYDWEENFKEAILEKTLSTDDSSQ